MPPLPQYHSSQDCLAICQWQTHWGPYISVPQVENVGLLIQRASMSTRKLEARVGPWALGTWIWVLQCLWNHARGQDQAANKQLFTVSRPELNQCYRNRGAQRSWSCVFNATDYQESAKKLIPLNSSLRIIIQGKFNFSSLIVFERIWLTSK